MEVIVRPPAGCSLMDDPIFQDSEAEESFPIPCGGVWFRKGARMPDTLSRLRRLTPSHPHPFPLLHPTPRTRVRARGSPLKTISNSCQ